MDQALSTRAHGPHPIWDPGPGSPGDGVGNSEGEGGRLSRGGGGGETGAGGHSRLPSTDSGFDSLSRSYHKTFAKMSADMTSSEGLLGNSGSSPSRTPLKTLTSRLLEPRALWDSQDQGQGSRLGQGSLLTSSSATDRPPHRSPGVSSSLLSASATCQSRPRSSTEGSVPGGYASSCFPCHSTSSSSRGGGFSASSSPQTGIASLSSGKSVDGNTTIPVTSRTGVGSGGATASPVRGERGVNLDTRPRTLSCGSTAAVPSLSRTAAASFSSYRASLAGTKGKQLEVDLGIRPVTRTNYDKESSAVASDLLSGKSCESRPRTSSTGSNHQPRLASSAGLRPRAISVGETLGSAPTTRGEDFVVDQQRGRESGYTMSRSLDSASTPAPTFSTPSSLVRSAAGGSGSVNLIYQKSALVDRSDLPPRANREPYPRSSVSFVGGTKNVPPLIRYGLSSVTRTSTSSFTPASTSVPLVSRRTLSPDGRGAGGENTARGRGRVLAGSPLTLVASSTSVITSPLRAPQESECGIGDRQSLSAVPRLAGLPAEDFAGCPESSSIAPTSASAVSNSALHEAVANGRPTADMQNEAHRPHSQGHQTGNLHHHFRPRVTPLIPVRAAVSSSSPRTLQVRLTPSSSSAGECRMGGALKPLIVHQARSRTPVTLASFSTSTSPAGGADSDRSGDTGPVYSPSSGRPSQASSDDRSSETGGLIGADPLHKKEEELPQRFLIYKVSSLGSSAGSKAEAVPNWSSGGTRIQVLHHPVSTPPPEDQSFPQPPLHLHLLNHPSSPVTSRSGVAFGGLRPRPPSVVYRSKLSPVLARSLLRARAIPVGPGPGLDSILAASAHSARAAANNGMITIPVQHVDTCSAVLKKPETSDCVSSSSSSPSVRILPATRDASEPLLDSTRSDNPQLCSAAAIAAGATSSCDLDTPSAGGDVASGDVTGSDDLSLAKVRLAQPETSAAEAEPVPARTEGLGAQKDRQGDSPPVLDLQQEVPWLERRKRMDSALAWLKGELASLREMDTELMTQFRRCQETIEALKQQHEGHGWGEAELGDWGWGLEGSEIDEEEEWEDWEIAEFERLWAENPNAQQLNIVLMPIKPDLATGENTTTGMEGNLFNETVAKNVENRSSSSTDDSSEKRSASVECSSKDNQVAVANPDWTAKVKNNVMVTPINGINREECSVSSKSQKEETVKTGRSFSVIENGRKSPSPIKQDIEATL